MNVYLSFLIFSFALLFVIFSVPINISNGAITNDFFINFYYGFWGSTCHQLPERSFYVGGIMLPVCARCLGIYLGLFVGSILYPIFFKINSIKTPKKQILFPLILPVIIDGIVQSAGLYSSGNISRLLTGVFFSVGIVFFCVPFINLQLRAD